ncbi:MAG: hypothetical protein DRP74_04530 [Candidatus Omnitrophota bacterium]|nr:MAG: hypothetical protein DRP74_04530 [Candidatus Omnitrophota bacterium]
MEEKELQKFQNPINILKIIFRRKWLFITPLFLAIVLGIVGSFLLPPSWDSSAIILVEEEKIINPLIQGLAVSTTTVQRMQNIREILLGWMSLVELTKKLSLDKDVCSQYQYEQLILDLRKNINVRMRGPNIIQISYIGRKSPQETQMVAKTLTDILVQKNIESQTKETDVAIQFLQEQLAIYKRKIKQSEIANLNEQLKQLLLDSTEKHPLVKELRQKIDVAKAELETGEYKVSENEQPITSATREALKQELDKIIQKETDKTLSGSTAYAAETHDANDSIYKLYLMDRVDSALARDINVNETIYNILLQKLETAKITQRLETSKEGTRYTIIDPPRLPLRPSGPNKLKVMILALFLGGISGTGLVFGREFLDHSFVDIEDAKENLQLPVLGAISRVTTQEEINNEKQTRKRWIVTVTVVSAIAIFISMLIAFFK